MYLKTIALMYLRVITWPAIMAILVLIVGDETIEHLGLYDDIGGTGAAIAGGLLALIGTVVGFVISEKIN